MHGPTTEFHPRVQRCQPCQFIPNRRCLFFPTADLKSLVPDLNYVL